MPRTTEEEFPNINCVQATSSRDKGRNWLGIWYDMEVTWHSDEWNPEVMPAFDNALFIGVTLALRGSGHKDGHDLVCRHQLLEQARELVAIGTRLQGKGGWRVVFGCARFPPPKAPPLDVTKYQDGHLLVPIDMFDDMARAKQWPSNWKDDYLKLPIEGKGLCFTARVDAVTEGDRFLVKFVDKNLTLMTTPDDWWHPTVEEVEAHLYRTGS